MLAASIKIKEKEFQDWPTHMEVQGARVYKQAGDLMAACTEYKQLKKQESDPVWLVGKQFNQVENLITQCYRNIAANIRFLEKLEMQKNQLLDLMASLYDDKVSDGEIDIFDQTNPEEVWVQ
jgi:hypothetical protein